MKALVRSMLFAAVAGASPRRPLAGDGRSDARRARALSAGRIVAWPALDGGAAGPMSVWVWLPPGYDAARGKRYPVLYMHDGQNLFDRRLTKFDQEWGIDEAMPRMARQGDLREWIVVGVQSPRVALSRRCSRKRCCPCCRRRSRSGSMTLEDGNAEGAASRRTPICRFLTGTVKRARRRQLPHACRARRHGGDGQLDGRADGLLRDGRISPVFGQAAAVSMHVALASPTEKGVDHAAAAARRGRRRFATICATSRMRPGDQPAVHRPWHGDARRQLRALFGGGACRCSQRAGWRGAALRVPHLCRGRA